MCPGSLKFGHLLFRVKQNQKETKMNKAKELLQNALNIGDKNPATAVVIIRKALKRLEKINAENEEKWINEMMEPEILRGKVF